MHIWALLAPALWVSEFGMRDHFFRILFHEDLLVIVHYFWSGRISHKEEKVHSLL